MKIAVVISTYNGEKYLEEQLDSIINQENVDVDIYVRDDGSEDNTINILKLYSQKYNNIFVEYGENVGFRRSFINGLKQISKKYDLYAFCDQDDFWEKDKLYKAESLIKEYQYIEKPILYYSNLKICDEQLNVKEITKLHKRKQSIESIVLRRSIAGCTMVFNYEFVKVLLNEEITDDMLVRGHDSFLITLCFAINGNVICDSNAYIKYRKHNNNTSISTSTLYGRICKEYEMLIKKKGKESKIATEILDKWDDKIDEKNKKILETIKDVDKLKNRLRIFFSFKYRTGNFLLTLVGKIKALFGLL